MASSPIASPGKPVYESSFQLERGKGLFCASLSEPLASTPSPRIFVRLQHPRPRSKPTDSLVGWLKPRHLFFPQMPRTGSASGHMSSKLTGLRGPRHAGRSLSSTLFDVFWSEGLLPEPSFLFFFFFWSVPWSIWVLVPLSGIDPMTPALEVQSLNHLTSREVPRAPFDSHLLYLPA